MTDWKHDRIGSAERGENPMVLARMASGFAVMGDVQFLPGYCVLLASPRVPDLNILDVDARATFLRDMTLIGDAITDACRSDGMLRLNYEIQGNTDAFLHAHIWPRYDWEPDDRRPLPVFSYGREQWRAPESQYRDTEHGHLRQRINLALRAHLDS